MEVIDAIRPGIYLRMEMRSYHGMFEAYSKTNLANCDISPKHMELARKENVEKDVWNLGTAIHTRILQPERWEKDTAIMPKEIKTRRGKAWEAFKADNEGKTIITKDQDYAVEQMADNIYRSKTARDLIFDGHSEASVFWYEHFEIRDGDFFRLTPEAYDIADPAFTHAVMLKARPDKLRQDYKVIDLKSSSVITPKEFGRAAYNYRYHWSAWLTLQGLTRISGHAHTDYYFVVVENKPPYEVAVYKTPPEVVDLGREEIERVLPVIARCDIEQRFPGMPDEVQTLAFPGWAFANARQAIWDSGPVF